MNALEAIRAYHRATCHHFMRYARGPGELDWETQPDPFRRYEGAPLLPLDHLPLEESPRYADVFGAGKVDPAPVQRASVSRLFLDSLALSAWKQYGASRWALRVNPSSGNLHPTEAYLVSGPVEGLSTVPMLAHYAPAEHGLEVRAEIPRAAWEELSRGLPAGSFFVGLTSIHWREAWKYGERAFRYCQHDCGHALSALAVAAAGLGWRIEVCEGLGHEDLAAFLGTRDPRGAEAEEPECLIAVIPGTGEVALPGAAPRGFEHLDLRGKPNELSPDHVDWSAVELASEVTRKPRGAVEEISWPEITLPSALLPSGDLPLRKILHQRRSAVSFDGRTDMGRDDFYRMLASTLHRTARVLPGPPLVHLALFVHRVRGLEPGLYVLVRDPAQKTLLQAAMQRPFSWTRPEGAPEGLALFQLSRADVRQVARAVSCHQEIASDGCASLGMLAEFNPVLERRGAWAYRRLFWECGAIGQVLYLEAEALGIRATGIGCFFDEPVHEVFGLSTERFRSLYHFTVGGPVDDPRLQSHPAYAPAAP
ncbi:MAG: SagB/ThcOx family dehydrogenase [Planctomycetota bacterium]